MSRDYNNETNICQVIFSLLSGPKEFPWPIVFHYFLLYINSRTYHWQWYLSCAGSHLIYFLSLNTLVCLQTFWMNSLPWLVYHVQMLCCHLCCQTNLHWHAEHKGEEAIEFDNMLQSTRVIWLLDFPFRHLTILHWHGASLLYCNNADSYFNTISGYIFIFAYWFSSPCALKIWRTIFLFASREVHGHGPHAWWSLPFPALSCIVNCTLTSPIALHSSAPS